MDVAICQQATAFAFLQGGSEYAPQSGQIIGILKQLGSEMSKGLLEATAVEEDAIKEHIEILNRTLEMRAEAKNRKAA